MEHRGTQACNIPSNRPSLLVVQTLYMSIVLGESQRDVRARPYFHGPAVCSHVDIAIVSVLTRQTPAAAGMLPTTAHREHSGLLIVMLACAA
jgi:hypothetical protein